MENNELPDVKEQVFSISKTDEEKIAKWFAAFLAIPENLWIETYYDVLKNMKGQPGWKIGKNRYHQLLPKYNGKPVIISTSDFDAEPVAYQGDLAVFRVTFYAIEDQLDNWLWFIVEFKKGNVARCYTQYATHEVGGVIEKVAEFFNFKPDTDLTWQEAYDKFCEMVRKKKDGVPEFIAK